MLFFLPGPHSIHIRNLNCVVWSNNRLIFIFLWYLTSLPQSLFVSLSLSVSIANTLYGDEAGGFDEATQLFNRIFNTFLFNITEQWFQLIVDDKFLATFDWFTSRKNKTTMKFHRVKWMVNVCVCVCFFSYYKPEINGCKYTQFYYGNALRIVLLFCVVVVVVFSPFWFYLNLLLLL